MHVTGGFAGAGNLWIKRGTSNGEKVRSRPEAQVSVYARLQTAKNDQFGLLYVKAIDDGVALGADAINMSLGSDTGSYGRCWFWILWMPSNGSRQELLYLSRK